MAKTFLIKPSAPDTVAGDADSTLATKGYVDSQSGGGFEYLGEFDSEQDIIVYFLTNDTPSGIYAITLNGYSTTLWTRRHAVGEYEVIWLNAQVVLKVYYNHSTSELEQISLIAEIESIKGQIGDIETALSGI